MKIVIDIPKCYYEILKKRNNETVSEQRTKKTCMGVIFEAVAKGTPLNDEE